MQFYMTDFKCHFFLIPLLMVSSFYVVIFSMGGSPNIGCKVIKDSVIHDTIKFCYLEKNKRKTALTY